MKIQPQAFKTLWKASPQHRGVVLYGQDTSSVTMILNHMRHIQGAHKVLEVLSLDAKECLAQPHLVFEPLGTQDLFAPQKHYIVHLHAAVDKALDILNELLAYSDVTLLIEAFGLPTSSKIVRWAQDHGSVMALPLYQDGAVLEGFAPFLLTQDQIKTIRSICIQTHESQEHVFQKLQDFISPQTSLTPQDFQAFIQLYDASWELSGYVNEAMQRADANPVGLSRLLFSDFYRHLKSSGPSWGQNHALFPRIAGLSASAQARVLCHFLTSEMQSMQHTHMPLCAAFKPVIAYTLEYQHLSGHLKHSGMRDVLSVRLRS